MSRISRLVSIESLGKALNDKRTRTKLSWAAVAGQTGCSAQTLSRITNHGRNRGGLDLDSYVLLCDWLQMSLDTFVSCPSDERVVTR